MSEKKERKYGAETTAKKIKEHTEKLNEFLQRAGELGMKVTTEDERDASTNDLTGIRVVEISMTRSF